MEKRIYYVDEKKINSLISSMSHVAEMIEFNMNQIDKFNNEEWVTDKRFVFDITLSWRRPHVRNNLLRMERETNSFVYAQASSQQHFVDQMLGILFDPHRNRVNAAFSYLKEIEPLRYVDSGHDLNDVDAFARNKNNYDIDFKKNKATPKRSAIDLFKERNTCYIETKKQQSLSDAMEKACRALNDLEGEGIQGILSIMACLKRDGGKYVVNKKSMVEHMESMK